MSETEAMPNNSEEVNQELKKLILEVVKAGIELNTEQITNIVNLVSKREAQASQEGYREGVEAVVEEIKKLRICHDEAEIDFELGELSVWPIDEVTEEYLPISKIVDSIADKLKGSQND